MTSNRSQLEHNVVIPVEPDNEVLSSTKLSLLQEASIDIQPDYVDNCLKKRVLVLGATGAGKTSLIDILAEGSILSVSSSAAARGTSDISLTSIKRNNTEYEFIDTPGFDSASNLDDASNEAIAKLIVFLASEKKNIHCVLFVWRKIRIDETFTQSTSVLKNQLIASHVPFILVVTGCEMEPSIEGAHKDLVEVFKNYNFDKIVCGTTLRGGELEGYLSGIREEMKSKLWHVISESCHKSDNVIQENSDINRSKNTDQTSTLWFIIISMAGLLAKGVSYGAEKLQDLYNWYVIDGPDGNTARAVNIHANDSNVQTEKENN